MYWLIIRERDVARRVSVQKLFLDSSETEEKQITVKALDKTGRKNKTFLTVVL